MATVQDAAKACYAALDKLAKWRQVFAGWQLGTRLKGDSECDAVRDHREATIALRAELNTLLGLMVSKGVFTEQEWYEALTVEAALLDKDFEGKFPGAKSTPYGMEFDIQTFAKTTKGWRE
jgi:hypothetical protein